MSQLGLRDLALRIAPRQQWRCIWCELAMARDWGHGREIILAEMPRTVWGAPADYRRAILQVQTTFEHWVPRGLGGADSEANGRAACAWCNNFRGTEAPESFKVRVNQLLAHRGHPRQIFRSTGLWPEGWPKEPNRTVVMGLVG